MKHTPGPWMVAGNIDHKHLQKSHLVLQGKLFNSANIAHVIPDINISMEELKANANLIAAAPDMFDALRALTSAIKMRLSVGHEMLTELIQAEEALKKAQEGGPAA